MEDREIRDLVRDGYARVAGEVPSKEGCCGSSPCQGERDVDGFAMRLGYSKEDLAGLPEGANLGLSCGNPTALATLTLGEVVLDLGSGAGFDVLIAARRVGPTGRVIGVDMTPEMIARARENAEKVGATNVEFRLGEIENLPLADNLVDVVISNCVINLSPEKGRVFREIVRVLKPGGRVAVSDMALLQPLPEAVVEDIEAYVGCVSGAVSIDQYTVLMKNAGLTDVSIDVKGNVDVMDDVQDPLYRRIREKLPPGTVPSQYIASVQATAVKA